MFAEPFIFPLKSMYLTHTNIHKNLAVLKMAWQKGSTILYINLNIKIYKQIKLINKMILYKLLTNMMDFLHAKF